MKFDFFKIIAVISLTIFLGIMIYFGFKEPPKEIIEDVKRTNLSVNKEINRMLQKENVTATTISSGNTTESENIVSGQNVDNSISTTDSNEVDSVRDIVKKNERARDLIYAYKDFQLNYLRYQQATSGGKFPEKGKFLKEAYEQSLEKLLSFNTEDDYRLLIDFALSREWRDLVRQYFFNRLGSVQDNIKDTVILEKLLQPLPEKNVALLLKGLSPKLSQENKERIINIFAKIPPNYGEAKEKIQDIINRQ